MAIPERGCTTVGKVGKEPEWGQTSGGVFFCRLLVVEEADGPASSPTRVHAYIKGKLAERCVFGLGIGDKISVWGTLRSRLRGALPEILVPDEEQNVRLFERADTEALA